MESGPVITTDFRLTPDADGPQEVVTLRSAATAGRFEATAVRTWVTDLAGTGLEADLMDPVLILAYAANGDLASFHRHALDELAARRAEDYEVADLFVPDP
jgi:hypothetical protein